MASQSRSRSSIIGSLESRYTKLTVLKRRNLSLTKKLIVKNTVDITPVSARDCERGLCGHTGEWTNATTAARGSCVQLEIEERRSLFTGPCGHRHSRAVVNQFLEQNPTIGEQSLRNSDLTRSTTCILCHTTTPPKLPLGPYYHHYNDGCNYYDYTTTTNYKILLLHTQLPASDSTL